MSNEGSVANLLGMAKTAVLGGNNDEALSYFNRVLEIDPTVSEAWLGKGKAAVWQSTLVNIRLPEALIAFNHAIANAENKDAVTAEAVHEINHIVATLYGMARKHMVEYAALDNIWSAYLNEVGQMVDALEGARVWSPLNKTTLENIIHLCKDNIEGYTFRNKFANNAPVLLSISPQYEKLLRSRMDQAIEGLRSIDPAYAPPAIQKKKADACFVVTATMGDFDHPDVTLLRRFRDRWIMEQPGGPTLVRAYYRIGPDLAAIIQRHDRLRRVSLRFVVRPAARFARNRLCG